MFDVDAAWRLHPQVAVRPESFGALLYHFGTRKLSFLKDLTLVEVVQSLADHSSASIALSAAGLHDSGPYATALAILERSHMLVRGV
jgi:putative mycofactocin binding protein MftB